jgi:WD40 repeat protein
MKALPIAVLLSALLAGTAAGLPPGVVQELRVGKLVNIAVSPNGQYIALVTQQEIQVLSSSALESLALLPIGPGEGIWAVAVAGDGKHLACGTTGGLVRLWELPEGQLVRQWHDHTGLVWCLAFSPTGGRLAAGGLDGTLIVWDTGSGEEVYHATHEGSIWSLAFSPRGNRLAVGLTSEVRLFDLAAQRELHRLSGTEGEVWALAFSPTGEYMAMGTAAGVLGVWSTEGWDPLSTRAGHEAPIWSVAFNRTGCYLVSGGVDRAVKLWRTTTGEELGALSLHATSVRLVAPLSSPTGWLSASEDGKVVLWDLERVLSLRPQVKEVFYTERVRAGRNQVIMVSFEDVNHDLSWAYLELVKGDKGDIVIEPAWSFRPHLSGYESTGFSFSLKVLRPQRVTLRLVLVDGAGLKSDPYQFTVEAF